MSAITPANRNEISVDPDHAELLNQFMRRIFINLACHHVATIQSFNPTTQTCTASINYKRNDGTGKQVEYPLLIDVPAIVLRGGGASLRFPISQGDQCVVMFNDRALDGWFQSGQVGPLPSLRMHSLADGMALVGLSHSGDPLEDYSSDHAELAWGDASIGVSALKVRLKNGSGSLKDVLDGMLDMLTTVLGTGSNGAGPVAFASLAQVAAFKTQVEALLE